MNISILTALFFLASSSFNIVFTLAVKMKLLFLPGMQDFEIKTTKFLTFLQTVVTSRGGHLKFYFLLTLLFMLSNSSVARHTWAAARTVLEKNMGLC